MHLHPYSQNPKSKQGTSLMSADHNMPLFEISDGDEIEYEDNPAIAQAKANLAAVERIQQERAEQRRLEREERKAWAEVERLRREIEEAEREQREIEEAEVERLTREKEKLEEENRVEQWCTAALRGSVMPGRKYFLRRDLVDMERPCPKIDREGQAPHPQTPKDQGE